MMAFITWNVSPYLCIAGHCMLWYGLLFGATVMYCMLLSRWFFVRDKAPMGDYWPVITCIVFGGLLGARLAHVFFYDWPYFSQHPGDILKIWKGGLASHGGALGIVLSVYLFARCRGHIYYWWFFDRLAVGLPLGAALVRLGNLFNSELYGKVTAVPWAFVFTSVDGLPRHPVQVYELLGYSVLAIFMLSLYIRKGRGLHFGTLTGLFIVLINGFRIVIEFFKDSPLLFAGLNTAQWLSVPFLLTGTIILFLSLKGRFD